MLTEVVENNVETQDVEAATVESNSISEEITEEIVVEKPKVVSSKPDNVKHKPVIQPTGKQYYIIAGSISKERNAQKLVVQLTEKGYSAIVADTSKNGMYRVAYTYFSSKADAKQQLLAIRQDENADAWLLRK